MIRSGNVAHFSRLVSEHVECCQSIHIIENKSLRVILPVLPEMYEQK